jgi:hypothetical protein
MVTGDLRFDTRRRALSSARPQAALRAWPFCDCLSADAPAQFARAELGALRGDRRPRAARAGGWWPGHEDLDIIRELGGPEAVGRPFPDIESPNPPCPTPSQLPSFNRLCPVEGVLRHHGGGGRIRHFRRGTVHQGQLAQSEPIALLPLAASASPGTLSARSADELGVYKNKYAADKVMGKFDQ